MVALAQNDIGRNMVDFDMDGHNLALLILYRTIESSF